MRDGLYNPNTRRNGNDNIPAGSTNIILRGMKGFQVVSFL